MRKLTTLALLLWCAAGCGPSSGTGMLDAGTDGDGGGSGGGGGLAGASSTGAGGGVVDAAATDVGAIPLADAIRQWCDQSCASAAPLPCNKSDASATACADLCAATLMQAAKAVACEAQEVDFFTCAHHDPDTAVYTCGDGALVPKSALCLTKKKALDACFAS